MSQPDFDEFDCLERKRSPLDWRNPHPTSKFFFKVSAHRLHLKLKN